MLETLRTVQTIFGWRTRRLVELLLEKQQIKPEEIENVIKENILEFWPRWQNSTRRGS